MLSQNKKVVIASLFVIGVLFNTSLFVGHHDVDVDFHDRDQDVDVKADDDVDSDLFSNSFAVKLKAR